MSVAETWAGPADLRPLLTPVESLGTHPENYRHGDVAGIATSLARFGQLRPIVVQESTRRIVAGNHTYRAATDVLGWTHIAALVQPMSDAEARAYLVADNRWSDVATNDDAALLSVLEQLGELGGTGYDAGAVEDLRALYEPSPLPAEPEPEAVTSGAGERPMRDVVMLMPAEQAQDFGRHVRRLEAAYGAVGVAATVREAVSRQAARLDA